MPPSSILHDASGEPQNVRVRLDDAENGLCNILLVLLTRAGRAQYEVVGLCQFNGTDDGRARRERSGALSPEASWSMLCGHVPRGSISIT